MNVINICRYMHDPRRLHKKEYSLECIFYITIAAVLSGAESWYEVAEFGRVKKSFFACRIPDFRGIPSHDTFNRVFSLLDPLHLERCFRVWIGEICGTYKGVVPIDGKSIRGARVEKEEGGFQSLHVVSAWAKDNGVTLGQLKTADRSNEITAIPELIKALDLKDCLVTIDAMGCQKEIVREIIEKEADYVISLKENQKHFYKEVASYFQEFQQKHVPPTRYSTYTTEERGHGRIEKRHFQVYSNGVLDRVFKDWRGLKSVVCLTSQRQTIRTGKQTQEKRYFITSLALQPQPIAEAIRSHWSIENNLHWQLDVTFNEDDTRKSGNQALNFSLINKIALAALKNNPKKLSLKAKRKAAGWDENFLAQLLDAPWNV